MSEWFSVKQLRQILRFVIFDESSFVYFAVYVFIYRGIMLPQVWFRKKKIAFGIGTDSLISSLTVSLVMWKRKGSFLELESLLRLSSLIGLLCVILVSSYGFILNWRLEYKNDLSWQSHLHLSTNHFIGPLIEFIHHVLRVNLIF